MALNEILGISVSTAGPADALRGALPSLAPTQRSPDWLFLLRHPYDAATALADFLEQLVTANHVAGFFVRRKRYGGSVNNGRFEMWARVRGQRAEAAGGHEATRKG